MERNQAGAINMKILLQDLFEISCVIFGLYVGYLLVQHIWSVLDSGEELFLLITLFCILIWLGRNNKDSFYSLFKDVHQSNLDDIERQQLEEPVDEVIVKEQILNSVAVVWFFLFLVICCVSFLISQESIGVIDWLIALSIIAAPLILAYFVDEWFVDKDDTEEKEAEFIQ